MIFIEIVAVAFVTAFIVFVWSIVVMFHKCAKDLDVMNEDILALRQTIERYFGEGGGGK